jgi:hypothetical protein
LSSGCGKQKHDFEFKTSNPKLLIQLFSLFKPNDFGSDKIETGKEENPAKTFGNSSFTD